MGIFDSFNQRVTGLGLPGGLGLLQAGTDILGGQPIGQAVRGGLQTFQDVTQLDEERKRKELVQDLVSKGGFTPQEQALILASQNPASVAAQIRAQKQAAALAGSKPMSNLGQLGRDLQKGLISQEDYDKAVAKLTNVTTGGAESTLGKLFSDYSKGRITKEQYDAAVKKATFISPTKETGRRIETDASGRKRFTDTGDLVFPDITVPDEITDTTDFKNFKELQKDNPNLTFEQYMRNKTPIQSKGVYRNRETGDIIGEVNFDPNDGTYFQYDPETEQKIIIDIRNFSPMTDATFAKTIPGFEQFTKNLEKVNTDRASMKRLSEYMTTVNNTNEGLLRLADQFSASAKTLLGGFFKRAFDIDDYTTLSKTEISQRLAKGKLQGLIGRFRIETVGGGVMTEQDALRIIANLGGDVNLLQNKEIVAQQLASLFEDKANSVNRGIKLHNNAVRQVYSESGYEPIEEVQIDKSIFTPDRSLLETEETPSTNVRNFSDEELQDIIDKAIAAGKQPDLSKLSGADLDRYIQLIQ